MSQSYASFGKRVRYLRSKAEDLSQSELDALAGLHRGHVWQIEEGHRENPTLATALGLQRVFGVSVDWLLQGIGSPPDDAQVIAAIKAARLQRIAAKPNAKATRPKRKIRRTRAAA